MPLGPVVVFGASNFPLAFSVAGGDTASALAVGCPVLVKAHSAHPETSALVGKVVELAAAEYGLPNGVFSMLFDAGYEVAVKLVKHPRIMAGAFTGSRSGGIALWRAAQARTQPIPFFAEVSSVNPIFVFPAASAARASQLATGLHASITGSVGQLCTKPGLIFVVDDAATRTWLDALAPLLSRSAPATMLTSAIRSTHQSLLDQRADIEGVRFLAQAPKSSSSAHAGATLMGVDVDTFLRTPALHEEIFGPTSLIVHCSNPADYLRCARALEGQLSATVWAEPEELKSQDEFLWTLEQRAAVWCSTVFLLVLKSVERCYMAVRSPRQPTAASPRSVHAPSLASSAQSPIKTNSLATRPLPAFERQLQRVDRSFSGSWHNR